MLHFENICKKIIAEIVIWPLEDLKWVHHVYLT